MYAKCRCTTDYRVHCDTDFTSCGFGFFRARTKLSISIRCAFYGVFRVCVCAWSLISPRGSGDAVPSTLHVPMSVAGAGPARRGASAAPAWPSFAAHTRQVVASLAPQASVRVVAF